MRIAFVFPTFHRKEALLNLIRSINTMEHEENLLPTFYCVDNSRIGELNSWISEISLKYPFKTLHEARQGASFARNMGLKEILREDQAEYIVFIDDDIILPHNYLKNLKDVLDNRKIDIIGSRVELYDKKDLPVTIKTHLGNDSYQGGANIFGFLHGCSMVARTEVVKEIGFFDTRLGAGAKTFAAEDADYYYRAWCKGFNVSYCSGIFVFHDHGRREQSQMGDIYRKYDIGKGAFFAKHIVFEFKLHALKLFYWIALNDIKYGAKKAVRNSYRYFLGATIFLFTSLSKNQFLDNK